ncbi:hypothetical protein KAR52_01225 [Candidatus Pacearchaeota archaeon]|nr:hypothetical protein [Candidatus Pacearchaeota archaeon]
MKKGAVCVIFLVLILFISNFASAYSFTARVVDDVKISFSRGDKKVVQALEVREKEIDSAIENVKNGEIDKAIKNLERAKEKLEIVQEKATPNICDEVDKSVDEVTKKIIENKDINPEFSEHFENYIIEEEKTKLSAERSEKLFEYCEELAKQDYELMLQDEKCNPDNAPDWLEDEIDDKIEEYEEESVEKMLEIFTTCINNPRECDCSEIPIASEKNKCEKGKALAIRCEFQKDESACRELDKLDIEMPSNLPKFLQPLFKKKLNDVIDKKEEEMFDKFAPRECIEAGATTREECEAIMMEKFAPRECIEAGATTKEECEKIMFAIHGAPPNECMENGEFIGPEACNEKMVSSGMIPKECIKDGKPISPEECEAVMREKGMMRSPPECEGLSPEECNELMRERGPPPECEGLSKEECDQMMRERGMEPRMQTVSSVAWGGDKIIPQECVGMSFQECEDYLMGNYMPQECINAGALTPEDCKRIMLPEECKQAGALTPEECGAIMINKGMPQECQDAGALTPEACAKLMSKNIMVGATPGSEVDYLNKKGISFDEIPDVCVSGSNFIRSMGCDEALAGMGITLPPPKDISNIPQECIKDGVPVSPKECQMILQNRMVNENIPEICREAGITNPEECGRLLNKERRNAGMGMQDLPPECFSMSVLECKIFMDEHGMEKVDVMGIMKRWGDKPTPPEKECEEGDVKTRDCGEGIEITECMCENGIWICADIVCPKFAPKIIQEEPIQGEQECEEGEKTMRDCGDGIEIVDCMCVDGAWACADIACPTFEPIVNVPIECAEMGIDDEAACEIVMSKINEERIKNGDQMIVDDEGNENYISDDEINKIVDEAEKTIDEYEPDLEQAEEMKDEIEVIERDIVVLEEKTVEVREVLEVEESSPEPEETAPEPEQESAPEPESSPEPESAPVTGETIREIQSQDNFLTRFFRKIFG